MTSVGDGDGEIEVERTENEQVVVDEFDGRPQRALRHLDAQVRRTATQSTCQSRQQHDTPRYR